MSPEAPPTGRRRARVAVVGHVEWVDYAVVERLPRAGEIVHARESFAEAAGGGAVAAVQLRKLAGAASFYTSLGTGPAGDWARAELIDAHGLDLHAAAEAGPQRRAFTFLSDDHERTITVMGARHVPRRADPLDWATLSMMDAVYFTGGDAGALQAARAARNLVATPRALQVIREAGVPLDVMVASGTDEGERFGADELDPPPHHVVLTAGSDGGSWSSADGPGGEWEAQPLPGDPVDAYGCGDSFAAGLTFGLGCGLAITEAVALAARCGAHCLTGRGPYGNQLTF